MTYTELFATDDLEEASVGSQAMALIQKAQPYAAMELLKRHYKIPTGHTYTIHPWWDRCATLFQENYVMAWDVRLGHLSLWKIDSPDSGS